MFIILYLDSNNIGSIGCKYLSRAILPLINKL